MKKIKHFSIGLLSGAILATGISVFADDGLEKIEAYLRPSLPITLDGKKISLENPPVMYDGSTHLRLRDVAAITGMEVNWNEETQTVELSSEVKKENTNIDDNSNSANPADLELEALIEYSNVVKIDKDLYNFSVTPYTLFFDKSSKILYSTEIPVELIEFYYGHYEIRKTDSPYLKGDIVLDSTPLSNNYSTGQYLFDKYVEKELISAGVNSSYLSGKIYNNEKTKEYLFSYNPDATKGLVRNSKINKLLFPVNRIFNELGLKLNVEIDENSKLLIFNFK